MIETSEPAAGTRQRILAGAAALFSEHGYAHGSIRNIATAIGIKGPSVYHHFRSKEEMAAAVLHEGVAVALRELGRVDIAALAGDPRALLDAAIEAHLRAYRDEGRALMALVRTYRQLPPILFALAHRELRPYLDRWGDVLRVVGHGRFADRDAADAVCLFLFGTMNAMVDWQERPGFALEPAALRALFVDVVMHGVAGQIPPRNGEGDHARHGGGAGATAEASSPAPAPPPTASPSVPLPEQARGGICPPVIP